MTVVTAGTRFAISEPNGDMLRHGSDGFYAFDTRFLSVFRVTLQDRPLVHVEGGQVNHSLASFYAVNYGRRDLGAGTISVVRDRYVAEGMHEDVSLVNNSMSPRRLRLELSFDADFADIFEVRRGTFRKAGGVTLEDSGPGEICLRYSRGSFQRTTQIRLTGEPIVQGRRAIFEMTLEPKQSWKTCVTVLPVVGEPPLEEMQCVELAFGPPFADRGAPAERTAVRPTRGEYLPLDGVPRLQSEDLDLTRAYDAAVADLRSLRMEYLPGSHILAAGLPWFMAVFGRDSIISAIQTKLLGPELMLGTLETLASLQATERDDFRDAAPGKVPHEIRAGELSIMEEVPHSRYYGTVDATPLFIRLLLEAYQWTGDLGVLIRFLPAAKAALEWMRHDGDLDGDGFLEYRRRTRKGLRNQGWKDSHDSIAFAGGALAEGAIALAEVQGYAYDAMRSMAEIHRLLGEEEEARALESRSLKLRQAFDEAFWLPDEGFYAVALDGRKRPVDAIASNAGHCLWSGIVEERRARAVVERLMSGEMFSGWGIRTLSAGMARYNPLSYHNGSIWPHDNSLIAAGMARYGFLREARTVANSIIEASAHFADHRLPELFAGYTRRGQSFPVRYPDANVPQAWACGAVIYFIETLLGVMVSGDKLMLQPRSDGLGRIHLDGVAFRGARLEI